MVSNFDSMTQSFKVNTANPAQTSKSKSDWAQSASPAHGLATGTIAAW